MIRALDARDAEAVAALIRTAFAAITVPLAPPPGALSETADSVRSSGGAVWEEAGLQGCLLWREQDGGLYVGRLAVHPSARGRGIARALLAAAEAEARRRGLARLLAGVRLAMAGNRRLFASAGFVETALQTHVGFQAPTSVDVVKAL